LTLFDIAIGRESRRSSHYNLHSLFLLRKKYLSSTKCFLLYAHSLSVRIRKVTHIVTVYDHRRLYTIIYDRIRQLYSCVYGVENFTFESLRIFTQSPYTESVSHRFTPYTVPVFGNSVRPPYISVFLRKRSFTTVHIRPGFSRDELSPSQWKNNGQAVWIPIDRSSRVYIKQKRVRLIVFSFFLNRSNGYQRGNYFAPYIPILKTHHFFIGFFNLHLSHYFLVHGSKGGEYANIQIITS
jgi:hypothetical protein